MITSQTAKNYNGLIQIHGTTKISVLNDMELILKILLQRLEQTDTISCVL